MKMGKDLLNKKSIISIETISIIFFALIILMGATFFTANIFLKSKIQDVSSERFFKEKERYVEDEVIVKFKENKVDLDKSAGREKSEDFGQAKSLDKEEDIKKENISVYEIQDGDPVDEKIKQIESSLNVEYAQPNYKYYLNTVPNDYYFSRQWALNNTGQSVRGTVGTSDADIDAPELWSFEDSVWQNAIVAVIDTGVLYTHPDLNGNVISGWDFEDNDSAPLDTHGHGTHVSGIIAGEPNNSNGISGMSNDNNIKILPIKFDFTTSQAVQAINYAENKGAKVINASWGASWSRCSYVFDESLYNAIDNFNGLFVAAAGNNSEEHDGSTFFDMPADYGHTTACWTGLGNVISVAATNNKDQLAGFSDYGSNFVDIGAPGESIYSTYLSNGYTYMSGTSMAAPHVAGLAGLIWSANPGFTASQVKNIIFSNGDIKSALSGKLTTNRRINSYKSLMSFVKDEIPPTGAVKINSGATFTKSNRITLSIRASDTGFGIGYMKISSDASEWTGWLGYKTSYAWSLTNGAYGGSGVQGKRYVYIKFKDKAGNISTTKYDTIIYDSYPPRGLVSINYGASYTRSRYINLYLKGSDATSGTRWVKFSNNGSKWTGWLDYKRLYVKWNFTSSKYGGNSSKGRKYVYVIFRDRAGNNKRSFDSIIFR